MTSGYDGKDGKENSKTSTPSPNTRDWKLELDHKNQSSEEEVTFAVLKLDGEAVGFLRLPNLEHLKWLREKLSN